MSEQWMSVAQAATILKCHPRTIERRIASGKVESRRNEQGNVEVSVLMPDAPDNNYHNNGGSDPIEAVRELADRQVDIAAGSASALVHIAQENAHRAQDDLILVRQDLDFTRQELTTARKESRLAWVVVASMMVGMMLAVAWGTHSMTRNSADVRQLSDRVRQAETSVTQAQLVTQKIDSQKADIQKQLESQLIARAKAEGELNAYKTELANQLAEVKEQRPTTRPATLAARIASVFVD